MYCILILCIFIFFFCDLPQVSLPLPPQLHHHTATSVYCLDAFVLFVIFVFFFFLLLLLSIIICQIGALNDYIIVGGEKWCLFFTITLTIVIMMSVTCVNTVTNLFVSLWLSLYLIVSNPFWRSNSINKITPPSCPWEKIFILKHSFIQCHCLLLNLHFHQSMCLF